MADNNRISIKKTSRVLAITCVAYTTVATILYNNYQIDLIDYSTPIILGTVATITATHVLFTVRQELSFFWLQSFSQDRSRCIGDKYQAP